MPHQCTECGRRFPDGSKEMLSGCPDCGGNKFRFDPNGNVEDPGAADEEAGEAGSTDESSSDPSEPGVTGRVGRATSKVRDWVGSEADDRDDGIGDPATDEDAAQASARTEVVDPGDLPGDEGDGKSRVAGIGAEAPDASRDAAEADDATRDDDAAPHTDPGDRPDLAELREELNDQFESIKIVEPGQYELNLMELYDRDEYIISLMEDGRYAIEVPESWRGDDE